MFCTSNRTSRIAGLPRALATFTALVAITSSTACDSAATTDTASPAEATVPAPPSVSSDTPPVTRKQAVVDSYHGVDVQDDYRWLEEWSNEEVKEWSNEQSAFAIDYLNQLPDLAAIKKRVTEVLEAKVVSHYNAKFAGDRIFAMKHEPPKQQSFLVLLDSLDSNTSTTLVDPNSIDPSGQTSIDWYITSPDGKTVALSMSKGGSEVGDLHFYEVATGKEIFEVLPRVNGGTAGGDLAFAPDGSGVFYTRYPRQGERAQVDMDFYLQVYFHKFGTPTQEDRYELGKELPRIAEIQLDIDNKTGRLLATVQDGDGGEFAHFMRTKKGKWSQFSDFGDKTVQAVFGPKDTLLLISRSNAPKGKILQTSAKRPNIAKAKVLVAEGEDTIDSNFWGSPKVRTIRQNFYVTYQLGGPTEIRAFDRKGKSIAAPKQLAVGSVAGLTDMPSGELLFANGSFLEPSAYFRFDPKTENTTKTALASTAVVDFGGFDIRREFATSKDGTKVPLNILMPKGTDLNGDNPVIVTGYGGYSISRTPGYSASTGILLEQGVIYVVANIRGGGEYGEQWHRQGNLTLKQNVFDDFAAVIEHLHTNKYSRPERTAIIGGSNGGLLMGATFTQRPDLVKAAVAKVGLYDMLRVELSANGAFNIPEFGSVKDPEQFTALHAYSPYHHVEDGKGYPSVLFTTGANDPRVDPMQSRKMTARMQRATDGHSKVLLRTSNTGHGGGTPLKLQIELASEIFAFMLNEIGVEYISPARSE